MCCFSLPVRFVGGTKIFARTLGAGMQALAYSMNVEIDAELAMVLPIPVAHGAAEDAVRFIDLSRYPSLFEDLHRAFPPLIQPAKSRLALPDLFVAKTLAVHDVGDFEASFVPTQRDFARLDERFRLPDGVFDGIARYADYGFAVFRLKPKKKLFGGIGRQTIHPMAFAFPSREPDALFFPTVHVHDGAVHATAKFDHSLYAQAGGVLGATIDWAPALGRLDAYVDMARTEGLVDAELPGFALPLYGELANDDVWLRPLPDVALEDLEARGECFSFRAHAAHAHATGTLDARRTAWRKTARNLGQVARSIAGQLRELEQTKRDALRLGPLTAELPAHFINGRELWTGTSYMDGSRGHRGGPGFVTFRPFSERIEPQEIVLGFSELPDEARLAELHGTLERIVDSAAGN
jgi:hypothetical protein